ncbi:sigma 54-interacting transcriptional regulator [Desulfovibrio inopinatus]|uniref:sigma 54-interacting transcriptional regulator n=1 Tax=Desulfovibrio inopinatus TaxID=102109 RepID=UPI000428CB08|nr:sigma-54 dependent transcriptional regulator [Desulfovibrio inopinatus]
MGTRLSNCTSIWGWFSNRSLKVKLILTLVPTVIIVVLITGYIHYKIGNQYTRIGLERSVRLQSMAMAHEIESCLDGYRRMLLGIAQGSLNENQLRDALERHSLAGDNPILELAYFPPDGDEFIFLVTDGGGIVRLSEVEVRNVRPSPFSYFPKIFALAPDESILLPVERVELPFAIKANKNHRLVDPLVQMATAVPDAHGGRGVLLLGFKAKLLRNILSLYNSTNSPIYAFPRSEEQRYSYMVDLDGWALFQSASVKAPNAALSTLLVRSGVEGSLGRPGLPGAFLPSKTDVTHWKMISELTEEKHNGFALDSTRGRENFSAVSFLSYAPVVFHGSPDQNTVVGGVAFVDRSQLTLVAGYRHLDMMIFVTLSTVVVLVLVVIVLSRVIARPIFGLSKAVQEIDLAHPDPIDICYPGYETSHLKEAVNSLIARLKEQHEANRQKDEEIRIASLQERVALETDLPTDGEKSGLLPEIIGAGPLIAQMKTDILKASRVDVDVLVIGETGTGKQLAAEAIHKHSTRKAKPFISINCGALDENLLLDTLFGHTKGAFTEAKTDRKGAFLEADGGTLFLDEIQATSLKGQQALLRAIAMRKIKPLGSDREMDVNVRLIAATNVDLLKQIEEKGFREDLYYRLRVLTIDVPPLRDHLESIPALTLYYLRQAEELVGKSGLGLSRGAMEKMTSYDWPGNIRELVNCITRAVIMVEGPVIQAQDIHLEDGAFPEPLPLSTLPIPLDRSATPTSEKDTSSPIPPLGPPPASQKSDEVRSVKSGPSGLGLNERQLKAHSYLIRSGSISRSEYQELIGGKLSARTAIYDLNDMVKKGLLSKVGSGPATRYELFPGHELAGGPTDEDSR